MIFTRSEWSLISELFDEAVDRTPGVREQWLNSLPREQAAFRDTLKKMLAIHERIETSDFLETVPRIKAENFNSESQESLLKPGATIGAYVLEAEIGRGGMGAVWRARRSDGVVKRSVALKIPHPGIFTSQVAQRFALERDILADLSHPNIARLYDAGATESGQPYLALEYVEGVPLTDYCDAQRLDVRQRLQLTMQILEAVRYAHRHLVIHRDLKPSNILVTAEGQVRLLDFGIAKLLSSHPGRAPMTELGTRALTPDYAAPEVLGDGAITTATDVYSAGVVLYELLTGERPYRLKRNSLGALEEAIVSGDPIRPSHADISAANAARRNSTPQKLQRQLAGDLETIVLKALKKLPDERYATVDALRLSARNEAVSKFLRMLITDAAQSEKPVTVSAMLARSEKLAEQRIGGSPDDRAAVLDMLGEYYMTNADYTRAGPILQQAQDLTRDSSDWDLRAKITCDSTDAELIKGSTAAAVLAVRKIIDSPRITDEQAANCLHDLSQLARYHNEYADALAYSMAALQRLKRIPHPPADLEASLLGQLGTLESLSDRADLADDYFAKALEKFKSFGGESTASAMTVRNNWAVMSSRAGDPKRALELYDQDLQIAAANDPTTPPPVPIVANRANALYTIGRYKDSIQAFLKCTEGPPSLAQTNCMIGLSSVYRDIDDLPAARDYLAKAVASTDGKASLGMGVEFSLANARGKLAFREHRYAEARDSLTSIVTRAKTPAPVALALIARSEVNLADGHLTDAAADARQAISISEALQSRKPYSNRTGLAWLMLGRVLKEQGNISEARAAFQSAVVHLTNTVDATHPALREAQQLREEASAPAAL